MEQEAEARLRQWVTDEVGGRYKVSTGGINLIQDVLVEAFDERRDESWPQNQLGLSPFGAVSFNDVESALFSGLKDAVMGLVEDASNRNDHGEVQLIDLLEAIHVRWCTSWPFCRPPEPPSVR